MLMPKFKGDCSDMPLHVQGQVVTPREGSLTKVALEWPVSCVLAIVTGQFVRAGKLPATPLPGAVVGLLPRVSAQVGFEVRTLGVGLTAARV